MIGALAPLGQASSPGDGVVTLVFSQVNLGRLDAVLRTTEEATPGLFFHRGRFEFQTFDNKPRLHLYFGQNPPPPPPPCAPPAEKERRPALEPWRELDLRGSEVEHTAKICHALSRLCTDDSLNPAEGALTITADDEAVSVAVAGYSTFTLAEARAVQSANLCISTGGHVCVRSARAGVRTSP